MGLGNYEQNLIKSIAENDIREARKWAVAALNADTTQKNKGFVTRYKNILTSEGAGMIELPGNLKDILVCEDVSLSFKENRYYVTERQEIIAKNIFRLAKVSGKLMELMIPYKNATLWTAWDRQNNVWKVHSVQNGIAFLLFEFFKGCG